jgi:hypothetical protein
MLLFIRAVLQKLETSTEAIRTYRRMFLNSVEQLRMNTSMLSVKLHNIYFITSRLFYERGFIMCYENKRNSI